DLVEKAEAAEQAAEKALEDANKDGLITPTEKAAIEAENAKVTEAKAKADEAVKALPAEIGREEGRQTREDAVSPVTVTKEKEADEDGKADSVEAAEKAATDLVEKAEAAEQAAEKALEDANKDGLITPTEKAAIEAENAKVTEAKAKADEAVKALPAESTEKDGLQARVDAVSPVTVPEVTDADENGQADTVDAAEKAATDLVEKAEAAEQAAEKALEDANKDGLITPTEKAAIEAENAKVTEAKAKADEAVKALPAESTEKDGLQARVDAVSPVTVPEVTDADE